MCLLRNLGMVYVERLEPIYWQINEECDRDSARLKTITTLTGYGRLHMGKY